MIIDTKALLNVLHVLRFGLTSKAVVQQSDCFVFHKDTIFTYNDEISISHPFEIDINGAVPAKQLLNFLSKIENKKINLTQKDNILLIKGGKYKAQIKIISKVTLPIDQVEPPDHFDLLPNDFTTALKFCLFSCSKDMTKPALTCVHCHQGRIESSDNFRVTVRFFDDENYFAKPLLIPSVAAKALTTFDVTEYSTSSGWLHFKTDKEVVFSCRTYESMTFPDVQWIIDMTGVQIKLPNNLDDILKRANTLAETKASGDLRVSVTLSDGKLTVQSKGDAGCFEEFCIIPYAGKTRKFEVHPEHLAQIFKFCDTMEINKTQLRFEGEAGEFVHVVSLLM